MFFATGLELEKPESGGAKDYHHGKPGNELNTKKGRAKRGKETEY